MVKETTIYKPIHTPHPSPYEARAATRPEALPEAPRRQTQGANLEIAGVTSDLAMGRCWINNMGYKMESRLGCTMMCIYIYVYIYIYIYIYIHIERNNNHEEYYIIICSCITTILDNKFPMINL